MSLSFSSLLSLPLPFFNTAALSKLWGSTDNITTGNIGVSNAPGMFSSSPASVFNFSGIFGNYSSPPLYMPSYPVFMPKFDFFSAIRNWKPLSYKWPAKPDFNSKGVNPSVVKLNVPDAKLAERLNNKLRGGLKGFGAKIVQTAKKYKIPPALFAAILAVESGWGKYGSGNNFAGLMDPKTGCSKKKRFPSVEAGLEAAASNLYRNYIRKGLTTIPAIGRKYCPVGAKNDPNGINSNWVPLVTKICNQLAA